MDDRAEYDTGESEQPEPTPEEAHSLLERFVVENDDLLELEAIIGRFNVFDALGVVREEIRHSTFLAWLLDPAESHGQGQLFLGALLMDMLRQAPAEKRPLSPVELDGTNLGGVEVRREWRNIDLLIVSNEPRFVVAIENKIDSGEHSDQLACYRKVICEAFPNHPPMFVFLTQEGDQPSHDDWVPYSYADIHTVLSRVRRTGAGSIGDDVGIFLDQYIRLIGSRFMDDPKIDELCDKIYRTHRQALDLIFERKGDPRRAVVDAFASELESDSEYWLVSRASLSCEFVPLRWLEIVPPIAMPGKLGKNAIIRCGLWTWKQGASCHISVTPSDDAEQRSRLIMAILESDRKLGLRVWGKKTTGAWATVYNVKIINKAVPMQKDESTIAKFREAAQKMRGVTERMTPFLEKHFASTEDG